MVRKAARRGDEGPSHGRAGDSPSSSSSSHHSFGVEPVEDFEQVEFVNEDQRARFVALNDLKMVPTRFIHRPSIDDLGLMNDVDSLLVATGVPSLRNLHAYTYEDITLEFLSYFTYNPRGRGTIRFRLFSGFHEYTLETFGEVLGIRAEGLRKDYPRDGYGILHRVLTGLDYPGTKFKATAIHHPAIRIWCRLVGGILFGRPEINNMKGPEVMTLFAALNVDHGEEFTVNMAHFVASHLASVARCRLTEIHVGGLATVFAKRILGRRFDSTMYRLIGEESDSMLNSRLTLSHLIYLRYLREAEHRSIYFPWRLGDRTLCMLPDRTGVVRPVRFLEEDDDAVLDLTYYLIDMPAAADQGPPPGSPFYLETGGPSHTSAGAGPSAPPPPPYGQFQHNPFMQPPYPTSYYDPSNHPSTFVPYPPFNPPPVWSPENQGAMIMGICDRLQRFSMDYSITEHRRYERDVRAGLIPPTDVHPSFYSYPQGGYDPMASGSGYGGVGGSGFGGRGDGGDDDGSDAIFYSDEDRDS